MNALFAAQPPIDDNHFGLAGLLHRLGLPGGWAGGLAAVIACILLVSFVAVIAIFFIWLERKVAGRIQDRLGPTRVGGKFGWLQTLADGIKLLVKEDLIPADADQLLFRLGPYIAFCRLVRRLHRPALRQRTSSAREHEHRRLLHAGRACPPRSSASSWPATAPAASGRSSAACARRPRWSATKCPMAICVLVPVIVAGTHEPERASASSRTGCFWNWYVFHDPFTFVAFWTYFTCATASCKRAPFDLAEAESELVAGFHTEYSGLRWSFFFMAEYGSMFAVSGIAVLLFLGGWHTGVCRSAT